MPTVRTAIAATVVAGLMAACGGHSGAAASSRSEPATPARVEISGFSYHPTTITVKVGARVSFTNRDQTAHTATATSGAFDTGTIGQGATRTLTFKRPGVYRYYCQFHAFMRGEIVVK